MKDQETFTLRNLVGRPGFTTAYLVRSRAAAMRVFRDDKAVTAAGSNGAINIWRTRGHRIRATFYRRRDAISSVVDLTLSDLDKWLKTWWPELGDQDKVGW